MDADPNQDRLMYFFLDFKLLLRVAVTESCFGTRSAKRLRRPRKAQSRGTEMEDAPVRSAAVPNDQGVGLAIRRMKLVGIAKGERVKLYVSFCRPVPSKSPTLVRRMALERLVQIARF